MEINKLNEKAIQFAKPGTKDYAKSDGDGLYLWVTTAGGKLWRWGYNFQGKEKLMSYGKYPDVGLTRARELHAAARSLLAAGTDPMADRYFGEAQPYIRRNQLGLDLQIVQSRACLGNALQIEQHGAHNVRRVNPSLPDTNSRATQQIPGKCPASS